MRGPAPPSVGPRAMGASFDFPNPELEGPSVIAAGCRLAQPPARSTPVMHTRRSVRLFFIVAFIGLFSLWNGRVESLISRLFSGVVLCRVEVAGWRVSAQSAWQQNFPCRLYQT